MPSASVTAADDDASSESPLRIGLKDIIAGSARGYGSLIVELSCYHPLTKPCVLCAVNSVEWRKCLSDIRWTP
jgi:hypothetical protein